MSNLVTTASKVFKVYKVCVYLYELKIISNYRVLIMQFVKFLVTASLWFCAIMMLFTLFVLVVISAFEPFFWEEITDLLMDPFSLFDSLGSILPGTFVLYYLLMKFGSVEVTDGLPPIFQKDRSVSWNIRFLAVILGAASMLTPSVFIARLIPLEEFYLFFVPVVFIVVLNLYFKLLQYFGISDNLKGYFERGKSYFGGEARKAGIEFSETWSEIRSWVFNKWTAILLFIFIFSVGDIGDPFLASITPTEKAKSYRMCKAKIFKNLSNPSVAEVQDNIFMGEEDGVYTWKLYISGENAFGGTVQNSKTCSSSPRKGNAVAY